MTSYKILRYPTISFWDKWMLLTGISMGSPLSIWDNLGYPQDKVCCVGVNQYNIPNRQIVETLRNDDIMN